MNFQIVVESLRSQSFHEGVWLFPLAFTLHVLEEWPLFTAWAKRYASESFTRRDYTVIHTAGVILSLLSAGVIWLFPNQWVVFVFFAFVFAPAVFFNSLFHLGATAVSGVYCPGLLTAIVLYLPRFLFSEPVGLSRGVAEYWNVHSGPRNCRCVSFHGSGAQCLQGLVKHESGSFERQDL